MDASSASENAVLALLPSNPLEGVPPWGRLLLFRVWRGIPLADARAMEGSKVSEYMVRTLGVQYPAWRNLLMDAEHGALTDCPVLPDDVTRAYALDEEEKRHQLAMEGGVKYAHPYLRLGMEATKRIGQGAQAVAVQGVVINITVRPTADLLPPRVLEGEALDQAPTP